MKRHVVVPYDSLEFAPLVRWSTQIALISGNPQTGPSFIILRFPPNFPGVMQSHKAGYHAAVISGVQTLGARCWRGHGAVTVAWRLLVSGRWPGARYINIAFQAIRQKQFIWVWKGRSISSLLNNLTLNKALAKPPFGQSFKIKSYNKNWQMNSAARSVATISSSRFSPYMAFV